MTDELELLACELGLDLTDPDKTQAILSRNPFVGVPEAAWKEFTRAAAQAGGDPGGATGEPGPDGPDE